MSLEYFKKNFQNQNPSTTASAPATPAFQATPKTPYQQNVAQPVQQKPLTTREALGQLYLATQQNQEYGLQLQNQFVALQNDKGSMYYAPYNKSTNQAVSRLNEMGISTVNQDWYNETQFMDRYLTYNGNTNTPSTPKKNDLIGNIAYQRYQYGKSMELTDKAKQECEALKEEINYLTGWEDRNYSDDQIVDYIYGNDGADFAKKYPTLAAMDESLQPGQNLLELNEAIPYSKDWVYGSIWAARNNGGSGNMYTDMAMSALGQGNQWQENPDLTARLDKSNPDTYAPYTVGSTTDDVLMYYGISSYDRQWLLDHKPDGSDKTESDLWNKAWDAMLFTEEANTELTKFNEQLDKRLQNATDPEKVMGKVNEWMEDEYKNLGKLAKSTDKVNSLVDTASAINFSINDVRRTVEQRCAENASRLNGGDTLSNNGFTSVPDQTSEAIKAGDQKVKDAADLVTDATPAEQNVLNNTPSSWFDRVMQTISASNDPVKLLKVNEAKVTTDFANSTITAVSDIMSNMKATKQLDALNQTNLGLVDKCDQIRDGFSSGTGMFSFMYDIEDGPSVQRGDSYVPNSRYAPALVELYETVTGESAIDEDGAIRPGVIEKAQKYYDYIVNGNRTYEEDEEIPWLMDDFTETKQNLEAEVERTAGASKKNAWDNFMWNARIAAYEQAGLDATGLKTGRAVANVLYYFMDYDATRWETTDRYNAMMMGEESGVDFQTVKDAAAEGNAQVQEELENARFIRDYINENGLDVPDNIKNNINRYIAELERDQTAYDYFVLQGNEDFDEKAEEGKKLEEADHKQRLLDHPEEASEYVDAKYGLESSPFYDLLTETERKTYYYLYATEGQDAAMQYAAGYLGDNTYGVLQTRNRQKLQEQAEAEVNSGILGATWANIKSIVSAPLSGVNSLSYTLGSVLSGEEFNPNNSALALSQYSNAVNAATSQAIKDNIENPFLAELAGGAYEIVYNRGRSLANSLAFGGVTGKISSKILQEIVGATNMGLDAMGTAVANAKDKGAQDWQAYAIGGVTLLAETLTEGITYGNIQEAIHGSEEEIVRGVKDLMINWLTSSGVEEMVGESVNDIVENLSDEMIMGALSEHADLVNKYIQDLGLNPDNPVDMQKAEELARKDELAALAHTAIISYLSPGLDVFTGSISDSVRDFNNIRMATRNMQKQGMDVSMSDVRKEYNMWKQAALEEQQRTANAPKQEQTEQKEAQQTLTAEENNQNNEVSEQEAGTAVPESRQPSAADYAFLNDLGTLDAVQNSDSSTQAGAIGALFGGQTEAEQDTAKAAASGVSNLFGSMMQSVLEMKNLLTGARYANVDSEQVKSAIKTAALSLTSEANKVMQSEEYQNANYNNRAAMLAATTEADAGNEAVQQEIGKATYENRVAEAEKELIQNGALDAVKELKALADKAEENIRMAQESLEEKRGEVQAKSDALNAATESFNQDPSADNQHAVDRAANELSKADTVQQEYEQHLDNITRASEEAQTKWKEASEAAMRDIRQQAEAVVADQNQQRAERDAAIAEQQRVAAEQAAQAQAEEDQRSGKSVEDATRAKAEEWANQQHLEGAEREDFIQRVMDRGEQMRLGKIDMSGKLTNAEGYLAIQAFARKTGLQFKLSDTLPDGTRGMYQNGVVYLNNNLVKNGNLTIGQALIEAALHEVPHAMEQTKNYQTYRKAALGYLFGSGDEFNQAAYNAAIDQKIADYRKVGQELTPQQAEQEIVADFARLHLADKEVVQRFMDAGLGGKMRNVLHNINQALKNVFGRMTGDERKTAEYLRKAERAYQKAMNELAKTEIHPEGGQFSVAQIAQATGLQFDENTLDLYDVDANGNRVIVTEVTPEMISGTPVGMLIDSGLTGEQNQKAKEMMAGLMSMVAKYKDSNLIWEIGASTLSSTFSAIKSNSDPQYKTTVDFGTVCAKTQAIIDVMSQVMLDKIDPKTGKIREGMKGGLTREDIMTVYDKVNEANLSVPCPVCYVFSRWMGVPSLLGQMSDYQHEYVVTNEDGSINKEATQKKVDAYLAEVEKNGDAKAINNKKTKLQGQLAKLDQQHKDLLSRLYEKGLTKEQKADIRKQDKEILAKMTDLENQIGELSAYNWVTQALCKKDKSGKYVVDDKFKLTPDEILFDLNRTGEFAGYAKNWKYRNTRGAGMGKAIMPYSGETIGDILYGVKTSGRQSNIKNPWLTMDPKAAGRQLQNARDRARKQNLVGGQRLQSTSDFRPEWGLDYIMSFLELQAANSKVQMYTKVAEAVDFFASVGADVNLSIMGKGQGWHVDENGQKVLDFSNITGMDYETAKGLKDKYDNVQMILVGMNDTHIRLALANSDIDFVIPWHSSGNSKETLAGLISAVGEKLDSSVDYSSTQTDKASSKQTPEQKALWDARVKLLMKGDNALTQADRELLLSNPYTADLYNRFTKKGVDPDCYNVKLAKDQASQIFPYEYWDTSLTKDQADENGRRFVEYCEAMGMVPRFSQFKDDPGYWKLLIDRPMYDNNGNYRSQQVVDVTNARIGALNDNGILEDSDLPMAAQAKYAPKDPRSANYNEYTEREKNAIMNAEAALDMKYDDGSEGQYSVYGDMTDADIDQALAQANETSIVDNRNAIYVKDGHLENGDTVDFISLMLDGVKKGETRTHKGLSRSQWLGLAKDGEVYGRVKFGEPRILQKYDADGNLTQDYIDSAIEGTEYDISDGETKWYYPIEAMEDFRDDPQPILRNGNYGRYSTEGEITDADIDQALAQAGLAGQDLSVPETLPGIPENLPGIPVTEGGNAQRQFGRYTAQTGAGLHDDVKEYLYNHSAYTPDTNDAQIDRAIAWVQSNANQADPDGFFTSMQQAQNGDFDSISADGQARMLTLMSMAAIKGEQTGDHSAELLLADMFNKQGTEAGRALQARKMFRLMTPVGRMATLQQMESQINKEYGRKGKENRVHLSQWILNAAAVAETEDDFAKVRNAAKRELAEQMPANWKEKFTAIRMISMLGNPRTHIRNLVGNLAFMPAVGIKNKIGAALEKAFVPEGERTKTLGLANSEARAFAKSYAKKIEDVLRGEAKYNEGNSVQQERKMFGQGDGILSKTLGVATQALIDANGKALEGEDWIFLNRHFRNALAGYMTANNLTASDMKGDTLDKATAYAVNEAHKATYRDANEIADWMNKVKNPAAKFVINAVLPFKKTPMNILKRGVEYSPVSIIRALTTDAKHLQQWNAYQRGELSVLPDKAISPAQYIDRASAGLSGTGFLVLGALLNSLGFLKGGMDDDDDEFDKLNGSQEYSIEIGGVSYTIDWAAPICMPLFVGATIMDEIKKQAEGRGEAVSVGSVLDAMLGIAEPVTQLSMLDGLNSVLNPSNYSDSDSLVQVGEKVLTNYATSYVPTFLGQVARSIDTTRRKNFVESGADLKVFRSALEQVENKIPWLSQKNIPYRDVWGNADVSAPAWSIVENFLSPGYGNELKDDPVNNELKRIYQNTGNKSMIPKTAGKTVTINGKSTPLTAEQYDQYVVDRGQTAYNAIKDLMESPVWQICDDNTRALMITDAWTYANEIARHNVDSRIKKDSWVANAEHNGNFVDVAIERAAESNRKDYISGYGQTLAEALDAGDGEMYDLAETALEEAEASKTEIRGALRDYFKPLYQVAFETNDKTTMEAIEDKLLIYSDYGFKSSDLDSWLPSDDDEENEINQRWLNSDLYNNR